MFWKNFEIKRADPRWQLFWHHDVIVLWCDIIIPPNLYQKRDFWTYYCSHKFHCDGLRSYREEREFLPDLKRLKKPSLNRVKTVLMLIKHSSTACSFDAQNAGNRLSELLDVNFFCGSIAPDPQGEREVMLSQPSISPLAAAKNQHYWNARVSVLW